MFAGSSLKANFCRSAYVSTRRPKTKIPAPALSKFVIVLGAGGYLFFGEFIMITGRLTTYTQTACPRKIRPLLAYCDYVIKARTVCPEQINAKDIVDVKFIQVTIFEK